MVRVTWEYVPTAMLLEYLLESFPFLNLLVLRCECGLAVVLQVPSQCDGVPGACDEGLVVVMLWFNGLVGVAMCISMVLLVGQVRSWSLHKRSWGGPA